MDLYAKIRSTINGGITEMELFRSLRDPSVLLIDDPLPPIITTSDKVAGSHHRLPGSMGLSRVGKTAGTI